ncbi:MAG: dynamin family protein [Pseudomonadota bacterium]
MAKDTHNRFVSQKAWERIEQWSRRKPVFALMGEFSAGKSTLMNFLLRTQTLPTQVTATQLPPVWFSWGDQSAYIQRHDGSTEDIALDRLDSVGVNDAQFVRIFLKADILEAVDLIDTPGISDPKISTDVWRRAVGQANGVLWCTHATQAWRETERATWVSLPERLQTNSLLLVTRADALGQKDRQKVLRRINREAGHLFNRSILFSARDAIVARDKTGNAELWSRSGGGKMIDSFLQITEQIMDNRADMLTRYQIDKSLSGGPKVRPLRPSRKTSDSESGETATQTTPLKLVNPVGEATEQSQIENVVVTSFPVRPARVERRTDDTERPRIDAEEAERLRAGMSPLADHSDDTEDDDLRAFFRDSADARLDIDMLADPEVSPDVLEIPGRQDAAQDDDVDNLLTSQSLDEDQGPDDVLASVSTAMQDEPDSSIDETTDQSEERGIEVSVSSITALMANQPGTDVDDYEPEPETNGLIEVSAPPPVSEDPEKTADTLGGMPDVPVGAPLKASEMWLEIANAGSLPQDTDDLKAAFLAFLKEFDQIALEHNTRLTQDTLRSLPKAGENSGAEWHVL